MSFFSRKITNKEIICISLITIMLFILSIHFKSLCEVDVESLKKTLVPNNNFITAIKYYNSYFCYDKNNNVFYTNNNKIDIGKINIISPYKVNFVYEKINDNKFKIFAYSDKLYNEFEVIIADIPLLSIQTFHDIKNYLYSNNRLNEFYNYSLEQRPISKVIFNLIDNNYEKNGIKKNFLSLTGSMYVRGATSLIFPKKSYRIILDNGSSILGMQKDRDWILDALYTDESKIRNKFSSDMWNLINNNQKNNNDLSGEFAEVFIDNSYCGLYVLKEKVNKKNLNVFSDGILAKSVSHVDEYIKNEFITRDLDELFINRSGLLGNLELKYYSFTSLKSFYAKLSNFYLYEYSFDTINNTFDLDNFLNYKIFLLLTYGDDNHTKNQYLSMSDRNSKIIITPWDMDLTWGLQWDDYNELHSFFSMYSSADANWINKNIVFNMDSHTFYLLKQRYWKLRNDVITMDVINSFLNSYKDTLVNSGAAMRDSERWYQYDVEYEIEQIREWARRRIDFLDEYFK